MTTDAQPAQADNTTTSTPDAQTDASATDTAATDTTDWQKEAEEWKANARKHEERAKRNATAAKELEELKRQSMTDQEKAVDLARQEARAEAFREAGTRIIDAEVRAAAAGRGIDVEALLEGLDRGRFIDDEGNPKRDDIIAWVDRIAPAPGTAGSFPDLGQGARAGSSATSGDPLEQALTRLTRR